MIHAAAIQLAFAYTSTPQEFFDRVREPVERAVQAGARIVALPDYAGMMLIGVLVPAAIDMNAPFPEIARLGGYGSTAAMLAAVAPVLGELYLHLIGSVASRWGIHIVAGTVVEYHESKLFNTAYLIGPDGTAIGSQRQTHRTPQEIAWGLSQGDTLRVFDTGELRVGLVVGEDVAYPEVSRILALKNANLLIHPASYATWSAEHLLLDLWREVQSNQIFGMQACPAGQGQSAIYAPVEMTEGHRGVLAEVAQLDSEGIAIAELDLPALQQVVDGYPIFDYFNYAFYEREFPGIYRLASGVDSSTVE